MRKICLCNLKMKKRKEKSPTLISPHKQPQEQQRKELLTSHMAREDGGRRPVGGCVEVGVGGVGGVRNEALAEPRSSLRFTRLSSTLRDERSFRGGHIVAVRWFTRVRLSAQTGLCREHLFLIFHHSFWGPVCGWAPRVFFGGVVVGFGLFEFQKRRRIPSSDILYKLYGNETQLELIDHEIKPNLYSCRMEGREFNDKWNPSWLSAGFWVMCQSGSAESNASD